MRSNTSISVVNAHAEGEVGNIVTGGVAAPPGDTLWEQMEWLHQDGQLRDLLLNEPRGGVFNHFNLLVPAKNPKAIAGFLTMEPEHTPPMSGSNAMCVATVLLDTGQVRMIEPETTFYLECAAGLIRAVAECEDGKARSIKITNVPSFVDRLDAKVEVEGLGSINVDVAFGGDSYAITSAEALGFSLTPDEAGDLARTGARITRAANEQLGFKHPENDWSIISFCQFAGATKTIDGVLSGQNTVVIDPGKLDRSPCGTGTSARMAVLAARGLLKPGDKYLSRSIIGSEFQCGIEDEVKVGTLKAIVPSIQGRAWICGKTEILRDPDDPWQRGYRLSDTWPLMPEAKDRK